jgi:RHS repeat-associated protein
VRGDIDLDDDVDAGDYAAVQAVHQSLGRGVLTASGIGNRIGCAGYDCPNASCWNVRHRFAILVLGRWQSRDPSGVDSKANSYAYVSGHPLSAIDPTGLIEIPCPGHKEIPGVGGATSSACMWGTSEATASTKATEQCIRNALGKLAGTMESMKKDTKCTPDNCDGVCAGVSASGVLAYDDDVQTTSSTPFLGGVIVCVQCAGCGITITLRCTCKDTILSPREIVGAYFEPEGGPVSGYGATGY